MRGLVGQSACLGRPQACRIIGVTLKARNPIRPLFPARCRFSRSRSGKSLSPGANSSRELLSPEAAAPGILDRRARFAQRAFVRIPRCNVELGKRLQPDAEVRPGRIVAVDEGPYADRLAARHPDEFHHGMCRSASRDDVFDDQGLLPRMDLEGAVEALGDGRTECLRKLRILEDAELLDEYVRVAPG